ncbi:hypothetical protein EXIGLDRAFT_717099 [Exidia glandulosa HHB12029]|uniref:Uncharacterized protein n=1 Tax=Exidia glandulosa HHB12029 TaxID=1314781 RepID=A0A165IJK0_EXIGL|nr:hypothetical protein EXIGLDRAFT_717099 [Exidia glandulosa HHB12029]
MAFTLRSVGPAGDEYPADRLRMPPFAPFLECIRRNPVPVHLALTFPDPPCIQVTFSYSHAGSTIPIERTFQYSYSMVDPSIHVLARLCALAPLLTSLNVKYNFLPVLPWCFGELPVLETLRVDYVSLVDLAVWPQYLHPVAGRATQCPRLMS